MCTIDDVRRDLIEYKKENFTSHEQLISKIEVVSKNAEAAATVGKLYKWIIGILMTILIFIMGEFVNITSSTKLQDINMIDRQEKLYQNTANIIKLVDSITDKDSKLSKNMDDFYKNEYLKHIMQDSIDRSNININKHNIKLNTDRIKTMEAILYEHGN